MNKNKYLARVRETWKENSMLFKFYSWLDSKKSRKRVKKTWKHG